MSEMQVSLGAHLEAKVGELADATKRSAAALRRLEQKIPVDAGLSGSAIVPAGATTVMIDCGGPEQGSVWLLRRLFVTFSTPTNTSTGSVVMAQTSNSGNTSLSASLIFDQVTGLPAVGWYSERQVVIHHGSRIQIYCTGLVAGNQIIVNGGAEQWGANLLAPDAYVL